MKILTVEDNDINAMLVDRLLEDLDFQVQNTIAENGEDALQKSSDQTFDLILMDINLGDGSIDGVEVMQKLRTRSDYQNVPIVAVTCYALPGDKEKFLDLGFNEYVSKPIDHQLLLSTIGKYNA